MCVCVCLCVCVCVCVHVCVYVSAPWVVRGENGVMLSWTILEVV